jgi:DNA-binding HxlR family transcriptional regulator
MLGKDYRGQICSAARALEIVGDRWTLLVVRDALLGRSRFSEFERSLGVAKNVLADRLDRLVREGVLDRRAGETSGHPEYLVTEKGRRLEAVLHQLMKWGDEYYPSADGPPRIAAHKGCDGNIDHELVCDRCGAQVRFSDFEIRAGPGMTQVSA